MSLLCVLSSLPGDFTKRMFLLASHTTVCDCLSSLLLSGSWFLPALSATPLHSWNSSNWDGWRTWVPCLCLQVSVFFFFVSCSLNFLSSAISVEALQPRPLFLFYWHPSEACKQSSTSTRQVGWQTTVIFCNVCCPWRKFPRMAFKSSAFELIETCLCLSYETWEQCYKENTLKNTNLVVLNNISEC